MTAAGLELGTRVLEEGAGSRVDFVRLRAERRGRVWEAMERGNVDVLVLGRPANVQYVSGARQLWVAGTRPFGPACVAVRSTRKVHVLSVWDDGLPADIGHGEIYGLSWNPMNLIGAVGAIPGLAGAAVVGTDGMTPLFASLLPSVAPAARLADAASLLQAVRAVKTGDELACIATATAIAEATLDALVAALAPGVSVRRLVGVFDRRLGQFGLTAPALETVVSVAGPDGRLHHLVDDATLAAGDLVVLNPGVLFAGYEGGLGRTWCVGEPTQPARDLYRRWRGAFDRLLQACRPGASGDDLRTAWSADGTPAPREPLVHGIGLGVEAPVIGLGVGDRSRLEEGSVLAVQGFLGLVGTGGVYGRDLVRVGAGGPEPVSRYGAGPLA